MAENKWVTGVITLLMGVITPFITDRGPPCREPRRYISPGFFFQRSTSSFGFFPLDLPFFLWVD